MKAKKKANRLFKDGIGIASKKEFVDIIEDDFNGEMPKGQIAQAARKIIEVNENPKGNLARQFKELRTASKTILDAYFLYVDITKQAIKEADRLQNCVDRNHKRWSQEEDEKLIESVTSDNFNPDGGFIDMARMFGRTPGAIQSRITYLVGIKRISQNVAGKFQGKVNGIDTEGYIEGVLAL